MTHSLHRVGSIESLQKDYVFLIISARGFNESGAKEKFKKYIEIIMRHNPINAGNARVGTLTTNSDGQLNKDNLIDRTCLHAVFDDPAVVARLMRDLKEADLGLSVVVSGLFDNVEKCCREAGITRDSIEYSLGRWGKTEMLSSEEYLSLQTMCGHGLVSLKLIQQMVEDIQNQIRTPAEAAKILAGPCVCGIFNTERAVELLSKLVELS